MQTTFVPRGAALRPRTSSSSSSKVVALPLVHHLQNQSQCCFRFHLQRRSVFTTPHAGADPSERWKLISFDTPTGNGETALHPKSPQERHREHYLRFRRHRRQKWGVLLNPLHGLEKYGYTDPNSLNFFELLELAERASSERVKNPIFWSQMIARAVKMRDLCEITDLIRYLEILAEVLPLQRDKVLGLFRKAMREIRQDLFARMEI
eukprot:g12239.t1